MFNAFDKSGICFNQEYTIQISCDQLSMVKLTIFPLSQLK